MASLTATLARIVFGPRPEIVCSGPVWDAGVAELRRRTLNGRRESGAFLLGGKTGRAKTLRRIEEFVFYDDVDPEALSTGIVVIDGRKLWVYQRPSDPLALSQPGVLQPVRNTLWVGVGPRLLALDPVRGTVKQDAIVASPRGGNEVERLGRLV